MQHGRFRQTAVSYYVYWRELAAFDLRNKEALSLSQYKSRAGPGLEDD